MRLLLTSAGVNSSSILDSLAGSSSSDVGAKPVLAVLTPRPTRLNGFDFGTGSTGIAPNTNVLAAVGLAPTHAHAYVPGVHVSGVAVKRANASSKLS